MVCMHKKFVKRFVMIISLVVCLVVMLSYVIAEIFKENYSDKEILQDYDNVLYGSALKDGAMIKLDIVKNKKPSVIALGSSRVMQFRADFFNDNDFYTLGGLGSSIDELEYTWSNIKTTYIPKVVIVGIDPWWLNPNMKQVNSLTNSENDVKYKIFAELVKNKNMRRQLSHLDEINDKDVLGGRKNIGLDAAVNSNGYRLSDGSRQYGKIIQDKEDNAARFKSTYERMKKGAKGDRFVWCDTISYSELNKLKKLLQNINESGAEVVVFLPPFPHEVYNYMDSNVHFHDYLHDYIYGVNQICSDLVIPCYNFCDLAVTGASDNEAVDGFHGSEVAYARITELIGKERPLSYYIDNEKLQEAINYPIDNMQAIPAFH